jgi:hypothetical protein
MVLICCAEAVWLSWEVMGGMLMLLWPMRTFWPGVMRSATSTFFLRGGMGEANAPSLFSACPSAAYLPSTGRCFVFRTMKRFLPGVWLSAPCASSLLAWSASMLASTDQHSYESNKPRIMQTPYSL